MELAPPQLSWKDGTPVAEAYGDPYYSVTDGLAESRYVFLEQNQLASRLPIANRFTVGETGFGTGLNFLALWQLWERLPTPRPKLHFISTELHPLTPAMLRDAHAHWPELKGLSEQLIDALPPAIAGAHRRWFAGGEITLDLLYGDCAQMLGTYQPETAIDAWFLDGFAPAKNETMWSPNVYAAMAALSRPATTLASFTAAGDVRRGLAAAGFEVQKAKGYGTKRDMIVGVFNAHMGQQAQTERLREPSASEASRNCEGQKTAAGRKKIIIGAGIAGCMAAWRFAKLGHKVTLIDKADHICAEASGNPAAAFTPFYPAEWNIRGRVLTSGLWTMQHIIRLLLEKGHIIRGDFCGTLMLDMRDGSKRAERVSDWQNALTLPDSIRRTVSAGEASTLAGVPLHHGGWFYPQGGWFHMGDVCNALLADAGDAVTLQLGTEVTSLDEYKHTQVTLANAQSANKLLPELKLQKVHGQSIAFTPNAPWQNLQCVIHAGHALTPMGEGRLQWGATFRHHIDTPDILPEETEKLLEDLSAAFPELSAGDIEAWAGLRCTHGSRLPLIGHYKENISLHLAHGARGMLTSSVHFHTHLFEL